MITKERVRNLDELPESCNVDESSRALGVSAGTIYRLIKNGDLKAVRFGSALRIPKRELSRLLSAGE